MAPTNAEPVGPCENLQPTGGELLGLALGQDAGGARQDLGHLCLPGRAEGGLLLPAAWGARGGHLGWLGNMALALAIAPCTLLLSTVQNRLPHVRRNTTWSIIPLLSSLASPSTSLAAFLASKMALLPTLAR